ncbi:urea amidolyase associated protein UAAP1 [Agrobacterium rosae]|uniref:Urea carboxylase n=1 Tax=Agrobacterium rosae TaxID=1972867 RepID=A0AAE5RYH4_9HYPH|nr:urea amidolyase associated protein UAAP1 [Agrobacterium rosae]KAA3511429.1 DUF1989 domain-containing protein [Agrobacterium rosae]KAA3519147.1 DUF1989 domain-containing protein [Agrobacterium rosae]MCM2436211.1 DUF1989 domain-containing protein [Agrobacterium rosae]MQB49100.1 DUF1989 domain-containing protein [Agrobacterium rosae]POO51971.1 urea carboxylase [Agrobacterium rosae]
MHIRRSSEEIAANRARYDEHQKKGLEFAPKALPGFSPLPEPDIAETNIIHREVIPGGWYWSTNVRRGELLRVSLQQGHSAISVVAWSSSDFSERMNLPDTAKMQWTTGLSKGRVIFSDMGRVMFSIIEDSSGAHDCLVGGSNAATNARYDGIQLRDTRDNFVKLAMKIGLDRRDIPAAFTLFAPVRVDAEGRFFWNQALLNGNDFIELRAEMDMVVGFSNCPHPLDPRPGYEPKPVTITRIAAQPVAVDDLCRTATAEAVRGFENNALANL